MTRIRMRLASRYPLLAWTLAWALTGIALYISGVFNSPRTGPLWVALMGGAISWAVAGAFTFRSAGPGSSNRLSPAVLPIWALAYLIAFALAAFAAGALDPRTTPTGAQRGRHRSMRTLDEDGGWQPSGVLLATKP